MRVIYFCAILATALWQPANAAVITSVTENGNVLFNDASDANEVDFDAFLNNENPLSFVVELTEFDTESSLAFSGFVANFTGDSLGAVRISLLGGPTFAEINSVDADRGRLSSFVNSGTTATLFFAPAVPQGDVIGLGFPSDGVFAPVVNPGEDFFINLNGLGAGDSFTVELQGQVVPEPTSVLTWLTLAMGGVIATRRKRMS